MAGYQAESFKACQRLCVVIRRVTFSSLVGGITPVRFAAIFWHITTGPVNKLMHSEFDIIDAGHAETTLLVSNSEVGPFQKTINNGLRPMSVSRALLACIKAVKSSSLTIRS